MVSRGRNVELLRRSTPASSSRDAAPVYNIPKREVVAVEHPMIVKNLDRALKTFGTNRPFRRILDSDDPEECLPLYLRPSDPTCVPILSYNTATNNVILQVTVPKRTGRKRKRGSEDPYINFNGLIPLSEDQSAPDPSQHISSQSRLDTAAALMRSLRDNAGKYTIEAVAHVNQTHRFRGLSDFHQSTSHGTFMPKLHETMLTGDVSKMRCFTLDPRIGYQQNEEILPPPYFTGHGLPFNWAWQQNPNIFTEIDAATGEKALVNHSKPAEIHPNQVSHNSKSLPSGPPTGVPDEPAIRALVKALQGAFEERPIWTRRALANRIGDEPFYYLLRHGLQFVGYQFKGGPFRDAIIKYGIDPRTDKKYRKYQTLFFKVFEDEESIPGKPWQDLRLFNVTKDPDLKTPSHMFDGETLTLDGRVWQVCDITDPLLARLIANAPYRMTFERMADGWFTNGTYAKIKNIMKVKMIAIRTNKIITDKDFKAALETPDIIPGDKLARNIHPVLPDLRLTEEEGKILIEKGVPNVIGTIGLRKRIRKQHVRRASRKSKNGTGKKEPKQKRRRGRVELLPSEIWGKDSGKLLAEAQLEQLGRIDSGDVENGPSASPDGGDAVDASGAVGENREDGSGEEDLEGDDGEDDSDGVEGNSDTLDGGEEDDEGDSDVTDDVDYQVLYGPQGRLASVA